MSFIPHDDFCFRGKRQLGEDGCRAKTSLELRDFTEHYFHRPPASNEDINTAHANIISGSTKPCFGKIQEKPTWDFPKGGKIAKRFVKPDFFDHKTNVPQHISRITPHPKRLEPIVRKDTDLKKIWSDGRDREIASVAAHTSTKRNIIESFNEPLNKGPVHFGKKMDSHGCNVAAEKSVLGFRGVGNRYGDGGINPRPNREAAIRTNCIPFGEAKFYGQRKNDWGN